MISQVYNGICIFSCKARAFFKPTHLQTLATKLKIFSLHLMSEQDETEIFFNHGNIRFVS